MHVFAAVFLIVVSLLFFLILFLLLRRVFNMYIINIQKEN